MLIRRYLDAKQHLRLSPFVLFLLFLCVVFIVASVALAVHVKDGSYWSFQLAMVYIGLACVTRGRPQLILLRGWAAFVFVVLVVLFALRIKEGGLSNLESMLDIRELLGTILTVGIPGLLFAITGKRKEEEPEA